MGSRVIEITEERGGKLEDVARELVGCVDNVYSYLYFMRSKPGKLGALIIASENLRNPECILAINQSLRYYDSNQRYNIIRSTIRTLPILPI